MDRKFFFRSLLSCAFSVSYKHSCFSLHERVGLNITGKLIVPQELAIVAMLKGELSTVFHFMEMTGMNLSFLDASGIHAMAYSFSLFVFTSLNDYFLFSLPHFLPYD